MKGNTVFTIYLSLNIHSFSNKICKFYRWPKQAVIFYIMDYIRNFLRKSYIQILDDQSLGKIEWIMRWNIVRASMYQMINNVRFEAYDWGSL
jgi:hypothetical protein